ncbi:hypothetical protein FN976_19490 [Caenimonas sedimenti]|uniref:Uncharacterized protein n=1 Tax=Caenimonas sedimenti TaxID=2596921 RepID=A0A562ZM43_9BURK|nr:hypothetical protein [Caenimonas sedimenti]TWO69471.1 hypothetical protein FN976_19490 [Caenimonas sedimenti]
MDAQNIKQRINDIEQTVDEAKNAMQSAGNVPDSLRQSIEQLHNQARQAKKDGTGNEDALRQTVMQLEEAADRAKEACRGAGNVDPKLQQAVQKAHGELSKLKHQLEADSPA